MDEAIKEKRKCYKAYKKLQKQNLCDDSCKTAKEAYHVAKKQAGSAVWSVKKAASESKFAKLERDPSEIHRMAKQMSRENQDVCGEMPIRNKQGELCLDESRRMKAWEEHYKSLLNVEFPWDEAALPEAPPISGAFPQITDQMVIKALGKMKCGKAAGPSGIIVDMLKAAGNDGIVFLRELIISVMMNGKIPEDWEMSYILNLYKGKGDALETGSYRGLKLTEHVMKVMEKVVDE